MIRHIPTSGQSTAALLTEALWALSVPPDHQNGNTTEAMFGLVTMTDGSVWLAADDSFQITIHPEAILDGIADILQPWIDSGALPSDTNATLAAYIETNKGGVVTPYGMFPQLFKDQSKTFEELQNLGLIAAAPN